ncbi:MAG: PH domain-containing protein [Acidimicrobiales bacterium]
MADHRGVPEWHRLHPLSPIVRSGRHAFALFLLVVLLFFSRGQRTDIVIDSVILGLAVVANLINWIVTRWTVDGGVLRIETGWIRHQSRRFPLSQLQAVDVIQTGIARVFGLAELRLRMAASGAAECRLSCLTTAHAEIVRRQLLAAAPGTASSRAGPAGAHPAPPWPAGSYPSPPGPAGAHPAPPWFAGAHPAPPWFTGRTLFEVSSVRLVAGIVLTAYGATSVVGIGVLVSLSIANVAPGIAGLAAGWVLGMALGLWRRYNGGYGTAVAAVPEGLRIESGMVQTTAETIRGGSVQAVVLVEPLVWRAIGWCRLEVDVAGPRQRKENQSEAGRLRAVVPVGTRAEADRVLGELVPDRPVLGRPAPRPARWKAPLRYHFLGWGSDDRYVVASRGRVRRTTTWIPLDKVQSVRSVQGPWQRSLGLGTVLVDTAGTRVHAILRDRTEEEMATLVASLPDLARAARAQRRTGRGLSAT